MIEQMYKIICSIKGQLAIKVQLLYFVATENILYFIAAKVLHVVNN